MSTKGKQENSLTTISLLQHEKGEIFVGRMVLISPAEAFRLGAKGSVHFPFCLSAICTFLLHVLCAKCPLFYQFTLSSHE